MFLKNKKQSGQTLIEAMLAIFVITIALIGFLSKATQNYIYSKYSADRLLAINLARQDLEFIRGARDINWLRGCLDPADENNCTNWTNYKSTQYMNLVFSAKYNTWDGEILQLGQTFEDCIADQSCAIYKFSDGSYSSIPNETWVPAFEEDKTLTNIYKILKIEPICYDGSAEYVCNGLDEEKQIAIRNTSSVRWKTGNNWYNVNLIEVLYNWK